MNKVISSVLILLSIIVAILLFISSLLTYEKSLKFILNFNQDSDLDFVLHDSHWHPYKPSIEIDILSIKSAELENKYIEIEGLKVEFNLLASLQGNFIEALYTKEMSFFVYPSSEEDQTNSYDLLLSLASIKSLIIDEFTLIDSYNYLNLIKGELSLITSKSGYSKVKFSAQNTAGGDLDFRMNSIVGSKSFKDYKGYINTSDFRLDEGITSLFCSDCPGGTLDSKIWFTLIDLTLVKFLGDIEFKLNSSFDFINSINAKIKLEDPKNNIFRISSFVNGNPLNQPPEVFASLAAEEPLFFIPKIELAEDKFVNKLQHLFDVPKNLLLKGYISNLLLNLDDSFQFSAGFEDLSLKSNEFSISGLGGVLQYTPDASRLKIDTPYLRMALGSLFD